MCYFAVLLFLHVLVQHSGEQRVVALAVRNVICTAEGVTQRMDCRAARRAECKSSHVGSGKEVAHVLRELVHALADQLLIAGDYHFDSLVTHQLGVYGSFRGERGFNGVDQRVNGACAEHLQRKLREQFRNQHCVIREHIFGGQTHLHAKARAVDYRDVRDLAAGAAGGRDNYELVQLCNAVLVVVEGIHRASVGYGKHLCNVDHSTAADGNYALEMLLGSLGYYRVNHRVGRLAAAEFLLIDHLRAALVVIGIRIVDVLVRQDKIAAAYLEFIGKGFQRVEFIKFRAENYLFHKNSLVRSAPDLLIGGNCRVLIVKTYLRYIDEVSVVQVLGNAVVDP